MQETEFLGHWITTDGIQIDKHKIKAIQDWPESKNVKEIQQFAGLVNYYWKYLRNYSQFMGPLFKMLKKGQEFQWGTEQKEAFQNTKDRVTANPVLT